MSSGILTGVSQPNEGFWTSYTPSWTSTGTQPSIGNGSLVGSYTLMGDTMGIAVRLAMGSTTTYGTGSYRISLPPEVSFPPVSQVLPVMVYDDSAGLRTALCWVDASNVILRFFTTEAAISAEFSNTVPQTWATNDALDFSGVIRVP